MPELRAFNSVIALVTVDGREEFVDASHALGAVGVLPIRDLNGLGMSTRNGSYKFLDLQEGAAAKNAIQAQLKLGDDGYLAGDVKYVLKGLASASRVRREGGRYVIETADLPFSSNFEVANVEVKRLKGCDFEVGCTVRSKEPASDLGGALAFSPVVGNFHGENPFVRETRAYPVEFPCRLIESRNVVIEFPDGMVPESLPEPMVMMTPDKQAQYRYTLTAEGNAVRLATLLAVKKLTYLPDVYHEVRAVFAAAEEKETELLSLSN